MKMPRLRQSGFSLIELMISIVIGMLIIAGVAGLIARTSASRGELEKMNRQIENGRFAYETIAQDLRHAGFYGVVPAAKTVTSFPDACSVVTATMATSLSFPVQGISNYGAANTEALRAAAFSCLDATAIKSGTDVLVIRRASTSAISTLVANTAYIQTGFVPDDKPGKQKTATIIAVPNTTDPMASFPAKVKTVNTGGGPASPPAFGTTAPVRRYVVRIYFVSPCAEPLLNCTGKPDVPTLKRLELGVGPFFPTVPEVIAEGIEDLQADFGVNATGSDQGTANTYFDGSANVFVQCNPLSASTFETDCLWQDVVSVRIHLLARNIDPSLDYTDSRKYLLGLKGETAATGDHYKRHVYSGIVRLNNVGMNRECTPTSTESC